MAHVTARLAYEQRLELATRILRHTLRNKMKDVHGWADQIQRTESDEQAVAAHPDRVDGGGVDGAERQGPHNADDP